MSELKLKNFRCNQDLSQYTSSLLFDSIDTKLADDCNIILYDDTDGSGDTIAFGEFEHEGERFNISLEIRGEIRISFDGNIYTSPLEYPEDLTSLIKAHPYDFDVCDEAAGHEIYIDNNNWFEYIFGPDGAMNDGYVYEQDLSKATADMIKEDMFKIAKQYFGLDKNDEGLEIYHMLTLSTAHLSGETVNTLDAVINGLSTSPMPVCYPKKDFCIHEDYGYFMHIADENDIDEEEEEKYPTDIKDVLAYARKHHCQWIMFDCDAEPVHELPTYEW